MDEIGKYRKKKPQNSKSVKRSDHKHQYEKSITVQYSYIDGSITGYNWSTHCSICGRLGDIEVDNDDFRKPEYVGKRLWWSREMFLSFDEIRKKFPGIPMYRQDPEHWHRHIRIS